MEPRRYEPQYNSPSLDRKLNPHHPDYDPTIIADIPEPGFKTFQQPPTNTQYGYADPRDIPPRESPEPGFKHFPQPKYYHESPQPKYYRESPQPKRDQEPTQGNYYQQSPVPVPYEPDYKGTRPKEGQRQYPTEKYAPQKFDYQRDDRFHRVPPQQQQPQQGYDRSPRQEYNEGYDRSPRRDYQEGYDRSPRRDYQEEVNRVNIHNPRQQHADVLPPAGRANTYNTKITDLLTSIWEPRQPDHSKEKIMEVLPPAGRANTYSTKITDLLTSIREPRQPDHSMEKIMETNKGYLVMMRFREEDISTVVTAIQENVGTLGSHNGYVIGFAESRDMTILLANHDMIVNGQWWDPKFAQRSRFAVACFWFKDVFQAKRWFESANKLKQHDFPNSNPYQVVAVPLTYGRNKEPMPFSPNAAPITLLWCEFPNIYERYHNDFLDNYSEPARLRMKDFGGNPHVSISKFKAGWPEEGNKYGQPRYHRPDGYVERVGRAIKTGWVGHDTFISVSTFPSMDAVVNFYTDPYYQREVRSKLDNYSNPVFVAVTVRPVKGTTRNF